MSLRTTFKKVPKVSKQYIPQTPPNRLAENCDDVRNMLSDFSRTYDTNILTPKKHASICDILVEICLKPKIWASKILIVIDYGWV